jgi:hypothetical protein
VTLFFRTELPRILLAEKNPEAGVMRFRARRSSIAARAVSHPPAQSRSITSTFAHISLLPPEKAS